MKLQEGRADLQVRRSAHRALGRVSPLALAIGLGLASPQVVYAQAGDSPTASQIEELVVTARKRTERLRDIPTAATVLGGDQIRSMGGIPSAQVLLANVPGVNFANTANPMTSEVSVRGSGTSRATNAEAGVGLYRNGAYIGGGLVGGRTFTSIDLFDLDHVEVLRGVQGGLNGRNASGGSINVVSARPTREFEGSLAASYGRHDRVELEGIVNLPVNDNWAVRLGALWMDQPKGFYYFPAIDEYGDEAYREFLRAQVNYTNGALEVNALLERQIERSAGVTYQLVLLPSATYPQGIFTDRYNPAWNETAAGKQRVNSFELTARYDFGWAEVASTTMLRDRHGQNIYDGDALSREFIESAIARGLVASGAVATARATDVNVHGNQIHHARIVSQDVHVGGEELGGVASLKWVGGVEYFLLNDTTSIPLSRTPTAANPSAGRIDRGLFRFESWALYGALSYDLTEKLIVSGDLRYTRDQADFLTRRFDLGTNAPITIAALNNTAERSQGNVSYTATLGYKPVPDMLIYAKIGSAYRAGGFNGNLGDPRQPIPVPASFDNETVTAYEVGFKGNLSPNVFLTAAAYSNHYDNLVIQSDNGCRLGLAVCPVQQTVFAFNAGPARLWGIEVEATARTELAGGVLTVTAGVARQGGRVTGGRLKGIRQPQQPDYTETFNINYRRELSGGVAGFINLQGSARQGGVQEVAQVPDLQDFVLVNGRVGVNWDGYEIVAYSDNLFNESYLVFETPSAVSSVRRFNVPRTWGVQLRYRW